MSMMVFILLVEITTSSNTGTEPPTSPVFPPWGQTASFRWWQCRMTCDTCSVVRGLRTTLERPRTVPSQSTLKASSPPPSASSATRTSASGSTLLKKARSSSVTSAKSPRCMGYRSAVSGGTALAFPRRPLLQGPTAAEAVAASGIEQRPEAAHALTAGAAVRLLPADLARPPPPSSTRLSCADIALARNRDPPIAACATPS
mmetsp:Transcript_25934/g.78067  ORF Transcript_25934/g.78067 Transcript_25934/m.78067 type:complete len:202 (-) Transcript_25934:8-613(-)